MLLRVDSDLPLPAYEQVREQVVRMVAAGTLEPGHRLPTIRQLAADLGLAKGTVAKAYELLESDSVIATRGRKGSFVLEPTRSPPVERVVGLADAAEALVVAAKQLGSTLDEVNLEIHRAWERF